MSFRRFFIFYLYNIFIFALENINFKMKTLILHGDWLVKRQHFKRLSCKNKEQNLKCGGIVGFFDALNYLINTIRPTRVVVAWDGLESGEDKFKSYTPFYIENKKNIEKRKRLFIEGDFGAETDSEEEDLEILRQINKCQRIISDCYVRQLVLDKSEGADVLSEYVREASREGEKIFIFSREHDFYQLISSSVSVVTPKMVIVTKNNFKETQGYDLENQLLLDCFIGKGLVEGVKKITRAKLVKFFPSLKDEKVSYNQMCSEAEARLEKKDLLIDKQVLEARDLLIRNSKFLNLSSPFISSTDKKVIKDHIHLPLSEDRDIKVAINYFYTDGYKDYIDVSVEDFFSVFYSLMVNEREYRKIYNSIEL